jgi:hypothetical protein
MKKLAIAGVGALVLAAMTCAPNTAGSYFPLALNNVWKTLITTVTVWHGLRDTTITRVDSSQLTVVADTTLGGKAAWKLLNQYGVSTGTSYAVIESDRVLTYSSPTDSEPSVLLKTPLAQNATWIVDSTPSMGRLHAIAAGQENVTTPAGGFNKAWHIEESSDSMPTYVNHLWYAAGVGQVRQYSVITGTSGGDTAIITTTSELKSYTVK